MQCGCGRVILRSRAHKPLCSTPVRTAACVVSARIFPVGMRASRLNAGGTGATLAARPSVWPRSRCKLHMLPVSRPYARTTAAMSYYTWQHCSYTIRERLGQGTFGQVVSCGVSTVRAEASQPRLSYENYSPTSAPGLAHICAGTRPHLRRDSPTSVPGFAGERARLRRAGGGESHQEPAGIPQAGKDSLRTNGRRKGAAARGTWWVATVLLQGNAASTRLPKHRTPPSASICEYPKYRGSFCG